MALSDGLLGGSPGDKTEGRETSREMVHMRRMNKTLPLPAPILARSGAALGLLLGLAACVTPPAPPAPAAAPQVYPTAQAVSAGQTVDLERNEAVGLFGTRAVLAEAAGCSTVRMSDGQSIKLGDQVVTPVLAARGATCPERNARNNTPYLAMNRAVLLGNGLFVSGATQECFLPNSGGGYCRPASR